MKRLASRIYCAIVLCKELMCCTINHAMMHFNIFDDVQFSGRTELPKIVVCKRSLKLSTKTVFYSDKQVKCLCNT